MFAWAPVPERFAGMTSLEFSKLLIEKADVAVAPGVGFGEHGEGYLRLALVENEQRIRQAARNLRRFFESAEHDAAQCRAAAGARVSRRRETRRRIARGVGRHAFHFALLAISFGLSASQPALAAKQIDRRQAPSPRPIAAAATDRRAGHEPQSDSPPFRELAGQLSLDNLEEALAEGIVVGHGGLDMPRFEFSPGQIEALLAYITSIQRK